MSTSVVTDLGFGKVRTLGVQGRSGIVPTTVVESPHCSQGWCQTMIDFDAAAKRMHNFDDDYPQDWEDVPSSQQITYRRESRRIIESALFGMTLSENISCTAPRKHRQVWPKGEE